jgi:hypothetical protein
MRPFPFFRAPAFVFHAADLYRDVALRWRGIGLGYLLALLALVWIPTALNVRTVLRDFREQVAPPIIRQVPVITVRDGRARVAGDGPQRIVDADGQVVALIDLDAGPDALVASGARVLVTEERIYLAQNGSQPRAFELAALDDLIITQPLLTNVTATLTRLATALAYPVGLIWSFTYRLAQALLFSVLGMILASTLKVRLPFAAVIRLSVMALTPVILLRTAQSLFGFTIPFWWFVGFAVFAVYLYFGLTAVRDAPMPAEPEEPEVQEGF